MFDHVDMSEVARLHAVVSLEYGPEFLAVLLRNVQKILVFGSWGLLVLPRTGLVNTICD